MDNAGVRDVDFLHNWKATYNFFLHKNLITNNLLLTRSLTDNVNSWLTNFLFTRPSWEELTQLTQSTVTLLVGNLSWFSSFSCYPFLVSFIGSSFFKSRIERGENNIDLLWHIFMRSLVASYMQDHTHILAYWDDVPTYWATWPGQGLFLNIHVSLGFCPASILFHYTHSL